MHTAGPSGATIQENIKQAVENHPVYEFTAHSISQSDQAGPFGTILQSSNPALKLSYASDPPRVDPPAKPSVFTSHENEKPAATSIPKPGGSETGSSTLQPAEIPKPEGSETESPFNDAPENPAESPATMIAPEGNKTDSTPVQGMEPGVRSTSILH